MKKIVSSGKDFFAAYCMLLIWDPDRVQHFKDNHKKQQELFYKTKGIVEFDRILNKKEILI